MLSSVTGILGNVSQANYAAGNTFQDALARHRTANGFPTVSVDLGQAMDAGYVAERGGGVRKRFEKAFSSTAPSLEHVMRLIEGEIRNPLRKHRLEELVCELVTTSITHSKPVGLLSAPLAAKVGEIFNIDVIAVQFRQ